MRALLPCCLILLLAAPGRASGPSAPLQQPDKGPDLAPQVDKLFAKWNKPDSPGAAVAIVKDGKVVHQHGYGMASLEHNLPIGTATLFLIASVSKQFTVFLILLLAQGGRLSLDDDVRKHIPELPSFGEKITIRHLIHHTSGLREETNVHALMGRSMEDVTTRADFLGWVRDQKQLSFPPGKEYTYCNTGYTLLGLIVERVSGKSVRVFADEKVFKPLGMKKTVFRDDHRMVIKNAASSYNRHPLSGFQTVTVPYGMAGGTNLFTTVEDMARWDQNFYDGKVGGLALIQQMQQKGRLADGKEITYAGGLNIEQYRGLKAVRHDGSHGGYRSTIMRFPEQRFSVIILANSGDMQPGALGRKIADLYLADRLEPAPGEVKTAKIDPKLLDAYAGDYKLAPGLVLTCSREGDKLIAQGAGLKVPLYPVSETEFVARETAMRFRFEKPVEGKAQKVTGSLGPQEFSGQRTRRVKLKAEQLKGYEGEYYSPELRVVYRVTVSEGKLVVRLPRGEARLRDAWENDEFTTGPPAPFQALQFTRSAGASQRIDGFLVHTPRLRNLRFLKVQLPASP
ncbi:MAG: serine hydrolase [Gemmataceae bacterium]|nr:serine hydrolase [Gemmataceae bacterium]